MTRSRHSQLYTGATFLEATLPKMLEATFARPPRPLEATLGRFWLAFGATGTSKTNEFLKENNDFNFCVSSAPNALSEPQKAFPRRPKALRHYPQAFSGAPKSLSEPFSEFRWLGCSPFSLILKPHESQKRGKESVREQRLDRV